MASASSHNRIIDQSARSILGPIGCQQKGKSRLWFDDHGWWAGVIEFQPSSWGKGACLNAGAMWLWYAKDHWSFDEANRIETFHAYENDEQFSTAALSLARRAAEEIQKMRHTFATIEKVSEYLGTRGRMSVWGHYHSAIAASLAGNVERARADFSAVAAQSVHAPWVAELQARASLFSQDCYSVASMKHAVAAEVHKARALLKLPPCAGELWFEA